MGSRTDPGSSINEILIQTFRHTIEPLKGRYSQIKAVYNTIIYQETGSPLDILTIALIWIVSRT